MSRAVWASGRKVSPACTALLMFMRAHPALLPRGGIHTGRSAYGRSLRASRKSASTQVKRVSLVVTALQPYSISLMVRPYCGPTTL